MGGGDLNMKKSWHPVLLVNQERVWKAEKVVNEERKKLAQLRKERDEERQLAELQRMQEVATGKKRVDKLDWMYAAPSAGDGAMGGRFSERELEDYLLGKKRVDEALAAGDRNVGAADKDFIAVQNANTARDTAAKIREDPLLAIKRQEQAALQALMNRPDVRRQLKDKSRAQSEAAGDGRDDKDERRARRRAEKDERRRERHERRERRHRADSRSPRSRSDDDEGSDDRRERGSRRRDDERERDTSRDYRDRDRDRRDRGRDDRADGRDGDGYGRRPDDRAGRDRDGRGDYRRDDRRDERDGRSTGSGSGSGGRDRDGDRERRGERSRDGARDRSVSPKRERRDMDDRDDRDGRRDYGASRRDERDGRPAPRDDDRRPTAHARPVNGAGAPAGPVSSAPPPAAVRAPAPPAVARPAPAAPAAPAGAALSLDQQRAARLAAMSASADSLYADRAQNLARRAELERAEAERDERARGRYGKEEIGGVFMRQQGEVGLGEAIGRRAGKGLLRDI